jgi:hypothetical protein
MKIIYNGIYTRVLYKYVADILISYIGIYLYFHFLPLES